MWIYVVILYTIFSFRFWAPVPTDQNAAITLWGRPLLNTGPGAVFAPLGFIIVITVPSVAIQREFPAEPENIYRGELKEGAELTPQQRPPIRFQYRDSITQERAKEVFGNDYVQTFPNDDGTERRVTFLADVPDDGLSARVTAEAFPIVRFMIEDPCLFLRNIGGVDPAVKQIEDEMFGVLTRFYTRMSAAQALANMEWMSLILYHAVIRRVGARGSIKSWGVDVQAAFVKYLYTSHGINTAISQAAQAPFDKQQNIITAEGTKRRLILEGEGKARAARDLEQQELQGRARGMGEIAEKLAITGREAQAAEVARVVGEGGNAIIVGPEGMTQVAALGAAFSANQRGGGSSSDRES
jgi:hypothetical protein